MLGIGAEQSESLSSWRAWIEIRIDVVYVKQNETSLSSWRAWIEIVSAFVSSVMLTVALLMESVD